MALLNQKINNDIKGLEVKGIKAGLQDDMPSEQWKDISTAVDRLDTLQCLIIDTERVIEQSQKLNAQSQVKPTNAEEQNKKLNTLSDKLEKSKAFLDEYMKRMLNQMQAQNNADDKEERQQIYFEKVAKLCNANHQLIEENNIKLSKDNKVLHEENINLQSEILQNKEKIELLNGELFLLKNAGSDSKSGVDSSFIKIVNDAKNTYQVSLNAVVQEKEIIEKMRVAQVAEANSLKREKLIKDQQILKLTNTLYEYKNTNKVNVLEKSYQALISTNEATLKDLAVLKIELTELNKKIAEKDMQFNKLKKQCDDQNKIISNYKDVNAKNTQLEEKQKDLEKLISGFKQKEGTLNEKIKAMDSLLKCASIQDQDTQKSLAETKDKLLQIASQNDAKDLQIEQKNREIEQLMQLKEQSEKRYEDLKNAKITEYTQIISKCNTNDIEIEATIERNAEKVAKIHSQDDPLIKSYDKISEALDIKLQKYKGQEEKENELISLKSKIEEMIEQYNELQKQNKESKVNEVKKLNDVNIRYVWVFTAILSIAALVIIIKL
jgi:hypothetical protein